MRRKRWKCDKFCFRKYRNRCRTRFQNKFWIFKKDSMVKNKKISRDQMLYDTSAFESNYRVPAVRPLYRKRHIRVNPFADFTAWKALSICDVSIDIWHISSRTTHSVKFIQSGETKIFYWLHRNILHVAFSFRIIFGLNRTT